MFREEIENMESAHQLPDSIVIMLPDAGKMGGWFSRWGMPPSNYQENRSGDMLSTSWKKKSIPDLPKSDL